MALHGWVGWQLNNKILAEGFKHKNPSVLSQIFDELFNQCQW